MNHKIRFVRQLDSMQCGIACLAMICSVYGKSYSITQLESICGVTNQGTSLLSITKAAEVIGIDCITVKWTIEKLSECPYPVILHWDKNHFIVLYKIRKGRYYIANPAKGLLTLSKEELANHWISFNSESKGIAAICIPNENFNHIESFNTSKSNITVFLKSYIYPYKKYLRLIILALFTGCILQLILPFLTQSIVDIGIKKSDLNFIWLVLLGESAIVLGKVITEFIKRWLLLHISMRINLSMISDFFIKLLKLPMDFFDSRQTGDIMQRINDHYRIQAFITIQSLGLLLSFLSIFVFGIVLFIYDHNIFFVFIGCSLIYALWIISFLKKRKALDFELFGTISKSQDKILQLITCMPEIKLQKCQNRRRLEWEDVQAEQFKINIASLKLTQTQEIGSTCINELKNIIITILSASAVINGDISLGSMFAIQYIIGQLNSPIENLMMFLYHFQDMKISLERINDIHNRDDEQGTEGLRHFENPLDYINLVNLSFQYNNYSSFYALSDIDIKIPIGKTTAIVGASGCGKTTLIKLLLGYYKPSKGKILINGVELNNYDLAWWRDKCGVVMQDGILFSESILRNIAVSDGEYDLDKVRQAAKLAQIDNFIINLPLGYDTIIGKEGLKLSQGQTQRILIARSIYKDPEFVILDEATNSLDAKNEREIVSNLDKFFQKRTVIIVAHRLSTVKNADLILVMDHGQIIEQGSHEDLIKKDGLYYNLVKNQLELERCHE